MGSLRSERTTDNGFAHTSHLLLVLEESRSLDPKHAGSACCPLLSEDEMFGNVLLTAIAPAGVFSEIFVKENEQWPAVASQRTALH